MQVSQTLDVEAIVTGARWPDFGSVVAGLVARLVECRRLPADLEQDAIKAVCERERMSSTAMVDIGVSIPHSRLDGVQSVMSTLAVSPTAVYGAGAGTPISIVALVLSPPALSGEHLNFLSSLSLLLHSAALRRDLQTAPGPAAVLDLIRAHEGP